MQILLDKTIANKLLNEFLYYINNVSNTLKYF